MKWGEILADIITPVVIPFHDTGSRLQKTQPDFWQLIALLNHSLVLELA
jgi:hypothetical protein